VLGFLPASTLRPCPDSPHMVVFQSRAGFSPRFDGAAAYPASMATAVSIPCWVFSPLRRVDRSGLRFDVRVSIPCWVFSPLRPTLTKPRS